MQNCKIKVDNEQWSSRFFTSSEMETQGNKKKKKNRTSNGGKGQMGNVKYARVSAFKYKSVVFVFIFRDVQINMCVCAIDQPAFHNTGLIKMYRYYHNVLSRISICPSLCFSPSLSIYISAMARLQCSMKHSTIQAQHIQN